jgi:hypothetical protein
MQGVFQMSGVISLDDKRKQLSIDKLEVVLKQARDIALSSDAPSFTTDDAAVALSAVISRQMDTLSPDDYQVSLGIIAFLLRGAA